MTVARTVRRVCTVALAVMSLTLITTVTAHAAPSYGEENTATSVRGPQPPDAICESVGLPTSRFAGGCFKRYGDEWWVTQNALYGEKVYVDWENYLLAPGPFFGGSHWELYRTGRCYLNTLSEFAWGVCNKDYYEHSSTNFYGLKGSQLRWRVCVQGWSCSSWTSRYNDQ